MTHPVFRQPAPLDDEGTGDKPYPGAEDVADVIADIESEGRILSDAKHFKEKELARRRALAEAEKEQRAKRKVVATKGSAIAVRKQKWLWRDRFPLGGLTLLAGKGDTSKSTLFACFTAWLTTGDMKGEFYGIPRNVGYVVNEDSIDVTVAPRMLAHGADMERVYFLKVHDPLLGEVSLRLPQDIDALREHIIENQLVAVFVDPLSANVTGDKNKQSDTREVYQQVNSLAEETGCAIVGLAHTRKAGAADVLEAVIGSSEQTNVARSVHGLVTDPEEDGARILSCEKLNVGRKETLASLRFRVTSATVACADGDLTSQPRIEWLEETTESASDILTDQQLGHDGVGDCARWLLGYLGQNGGEAYSSDVKEAAQRANRKFSESMLKRARKVARVQSRRTLEVPSRTIWSCPENTESSNRPGSPVYTQGDDPTGITTGQPVGYGQATLEDHDEE